LVNGHKFFAHRFYQLMKCALCNEYLATGMGYQCESCSYLVHKKCFDRVVTKCIIRIDDAAEINKEQSNKLKHNVPHKFKLHSSVVPSWCCHCGYMLPVASTKGYDRCEHCYVSCHAECKVYVPNLCGMPIEKANLLLKELMEVEKMKQKKNRLMSSPSQAAVITQPEKASTKILPAVPPKPNADVPSSDSKTSVLKPKTATLDDFQFIAVLGKGNFGKVMLTEEKATKKLWAIKVLKKEFILQNDEVESTRSEKRVFVTINKARHPFLVGLHSCFQTETRIYFVMEYISGGDLMLHIQRQQFSEKRAKFYAIEVLLALEYFHQNGIIYRDLKLDNILLTLDGHVKVADYGLCKESMGFGNTTNTFCGTPEFMAPEILLEKGFFGFINLIVRLRPYSRLVGIRSTDL
jgi:novel protein kinase C epsilon type